MNKLAEKHTAEELRAALNERLEQDKIDELKKGESELYSALEFLKDKEFIMEGCPNPNVFILYHIDTSYNPTVKDGKWVCVKMKSNIRISITKKVADNTFRIDDEIRIDSSLVFSHFDDYEPTRSDREPSKFKAFHPSDISDYGISSISQKTFTDVLKVFQEKENALKEVHSKLTHQQNPKYKRED